MFERFTDRARLVVVRAQEAVRQYDHEAIGTEHLLLGIIQDDGSVAVEVLASLGLEPGAIRGEVERVAGRGTTTGPRQHISFTDSAKKVLELSLREALRLDVNYIGTEHVLLGLLREREGMAAQVLTGLGADLDGARERIAELASARPRRVEPEQVAARLTSTSFGALGAPAAPDLRRVVPIAREVPVAPGWRMVLLSLEVWSGWLDLRAALLGSHTSSLGLGRDHTAWSLSDDLGTDYRTVGVAVGGAEPFQVLQVAFAPGPPPSATALTLALAAVEGREAIEVTVQLK